MAGQVGGGVADFRFTPGEHQLTADRHRGRLGAQVAGNRKPVATQHDPALSLVVVDGEIPQPGVGEIGFAAPQRDQLPVQLEQPGVLAGAGLVPVQLGALERLWVLRVGNVVGIPAVLGEFRFAAVPGGLSQLGFGVRAEELKRRGRPHSSPMKSIAV